MRDKKIIACALSFNADPHPTGIYIAALEKASEFVVRARGNDFLKITPPRKIEGHEAYEGRILMWTEVDVDGTWLDTATDDEVEDKSDISIPEHKKPNYRTFNYVFIEKDHQFYFESKNEFSENFGVSTAYKSFSNLFEIPDIREISCISVGISVDDLDFQKFIKMPGLYNLKLRIHIPNGDSSSDGTQRVLNMLTEAGASQLDETWTAWKTSTGLKVEGELEDKANLAAKTGFVSGTIRSMDGQNTSFSSESLHRRYFLSLAAGESFFQRLLRNIK